MRNFSVFSVKAILVLFIAAAILSGCKKGDKPAPDALDKDTSYAFGMLLAEQLNQMSSQMGLSEMHFDYESLTEGFKAFNEAQETRFTPDEASKKISAAITQLRAKQSEKMQAEGEKNKKEGEAYLAENKARPGVTTTASGLQYEVITQGNGEKPVMGDIVQVNYQGTFTNGTEFDSSYKNGKPVEFKVGEVIPGWNEGLQLMNVGSTYRFVIPADLAYGSTGVRSIPPNSILIFKVELLSIKK